MVFVREVYTNLCAAVHLQDFYAFYHGGSGVIDTVEHGLGAELSSNSRTASSPKTAHTFN